MRMPSKTLHIDSSSLAMSSIPWKQVISVPWWNKRGLCIPPTMILWPLTVWTRSWWWRIELPLSSWIITKHTGQHSVFWATNKAEWCWLHTPQSSSHQGYQEPLSDRSIPQTKTPQGKNNEEREAAWMTLSTPSSTPTLSLSRNRDWFTSGSSTALSGPNSSKVQFQKWG